nr:GGDEF domain-containing phosphodiesterase [uncultured Glaciecola sp.]
MIFNEMHAKIEFLERRLQREKTARVAAESIFEAKNKEVYLSNQKLVKAVLDLQKLTVAVEQSHIITLITDLQGIIEYVNKSFAVISGYTQQQVTGKNISSLELVLGTEYIQGMNHVFQHKTPWHGEVEGSSIAKSSYSLKITISPIMDKAESLTNFQFNCEDVTLQKKNKKRIYHLANHDSLTKLYNRYRIEGILTQALSSAKQTKNSVAVLSIDMDHFKRVNVTRGSKLGDAMLKIIASRLTDICIRNNDYIARIGGDEFLVILTDFEDISFIASTAKAIVDALSLPYFFWGGEELTSSPSVGVSVYPHDGQSVDELVKNADVAMCYVKAHGRGSYSFFTNELNRMVEENNMFEKELRIALVRDELELYYQPQIYLGDRIKFGVEALIRWNHATLGFVSPQKFITIAEERGLIYEVGAWVIETAFKQLLDWSSASEIPIKIAVNISAKQIADTRFVDDLRLLVNKYKINPHMVELEITESIAMEDPEQSTRTLNEIRSMGFELAIDDFGTGYSSLSYLKNLPVQTLKLDRSFVSNLEEDTDNAKICKASISLSHDLGLLFVAEGVETKGQARYLADNGCDVLQGYYFCRPVPAADALSFIQNYKIHSF